MQLGNTNSLLIGTLQSVFQIPFYFFAESLHFRSFVTISSPLRNLTQHFQSPWPLFECYLLLLLIISTLYTIPCDDDVDDFCGKITNTPKTVRNLMSRQPHGGHRNSEPQSNTQQKRGDQPLQHEKEQHKINIKTNRTYLYASALS